MKTKWNKKHIIFSITLDASTGAENIPESRIYGVSNKRSGWQQIKGWRSVYSRVQYTTLFWHLTYLVSSNILAPVHHSSIPISEISMPSHQHIHQILKIYKKVSCTHSHSSIFISTITMFITRRSTLFPFSFQNPFSHTTKP